MLFTSDISAVKKADRHTGKQIKIWVSEASRHALKELAAELGMKEIGVASRALEWLAKQDPVVQRGVLGVLPPGYEADVAKLALERIAKGKGKAI